MLAWTERIVTRGASKQEMENQQEADSSAKLNTGAARRRSIFADILPDLYEEQQVRLPSFCVCACNPIRVHVIPSASM